MNSDLSDVQRPTHSADQDRSQYRHLIENLNVAVIIINPDSTFRYCNQTAANMLGVSRDELVGMDSLSPRWTLLREDETLMDPSECPVLEVIGSKKSVSGRVVGIRNPGHSNVLWILAHSFPEFDSAGNLLQVLMVFLDVTEHKNTEIALRQSREFVRATMDSLSAQICVLDERGIIVAVNRAWRDFGTSVGLPASTTLEVTNYLDVCAKAMGDEAEFARDFASGIQSVVSGRKAYFEMEYPCTTGATKRWFIGRVTRFAGGQSGSVVVSHEDITGRKQDQESLLATQSLFATIFQASPIAITLKGVADGRFIDVNAEWVAVTGWSREEALGKTSAELNAWVDITEHDRLIDDLMQYGTLQAREVAIRDRSGVIHPVLMSAELIWAADQPCILTLGMDITARKKAEEALGQTQEQLRQSQKLEAVGRLAGGVAHDFRNQLTIIRGFIDLLQDEETPPADRVEMFAEVKKAIDRSSALTGQLLAFSRQQVLAPRSMDVREVVAELGRLLPPLLGEDIRLTMLSDESPCIATVDPAQLHQALLNLATNARDAMPAGGTLIIETQAVDRNDPAICNNAIAPLRPHVLIRVRDDGIGMDESVQSRIFEPFYTTKPVGQGTGLGLPMVYGFIKQSGGFLTVQSSPGQGSQFDLYLPAADVASLPGKAVDSVAPQAKSSETILVVEDEAGLVKVAVTALRRFGYTVHAATDPASALAFLEKCSTAPDLLITDLVMAGGNGLELGDTVSRLYPRTRILYMSGYTDRDLTARGLRRTRARFLLKPFSVSQLAQSVRAALDG